MRAMVMERHGPPEVLRLRDVRCPKPEAGEVVVRVLACGVNRGLDARTRANGAGRSLRLPLILGTEIVGEVAELGEGVSGWLEGDRVLVAPYISCGACPDCRAGFENACADRELFGLNRDGGNAEYVRVPADCLMTLPSGQRPVAEGAALPISFTTAYHMLVRRAGLQAGETLVVLGAAGAVGRAALDIGKIIGARLLAVVSSIEKARSLPSFVDHVISPADKFASAVLEQTGGRGAEVVLDHVGATTIGESIGAAAPNGRLVICGASSGHELCFDARPLWRKCMSIHFSNSGTRSDLETVVAMWSEGRFSPLSIKTMALEELQNAHRLVEDRNFVGKIVITP